VNSLSEKGIINGYPDGTFGPTKNVNRAELAVMLDKTIQYVQTGTISQNTDIPVSYIREGLLTENEKQSIKENFVTPFVECENYWNPSNPIAAILITVPENTGEPFEYNAIGKEFGGSEGSYGKRGEDIPLYKCSKLGM